MRKERFETLESALAGLQSEGRRLAAEAPGRQVDVKVKRFEPVQLVSARLELSGPQRFVPDVHAGVDVRGDGSVEAFTGRVRKRVVQPRDGEDAYAALRRELKGRASSR